MKLFMYIGEELKSTGVYALGTVYEGDYDETETLVQVTDDLGDTHYEFTENFMEV